MREGYVLTDEMWSIVDARTTQSSKNKFVSDILLRSRKRGLTYIFTAQLLDLLDKRVRKLLDFCTYPILNRQETVCKLVIFRSGYPSEGTYLKTVYYKTPIFMNAFDTNEEIDMEEEVKEDPQIVWQESKDKKPMFFDTWEECDKFADMWWKGQYSKLMAYLL